MRRTIIGSALVVILSLAIVPIAPSGSPASVTQSPAPVTQRFGFSDNIFNNTQVSLGVATSKFVATGANVWRAQVSWQHEEQTEGQPDPGYWARLDALYAAAEQNDFEVLFMALNAPWWARTDQGQALCSPQEPRCPAPPDVRDADIKSAWKDFLKRIMTRYPNAAGLEVWNEPNLDGFWIQDQDLELYGLMVASAREAVDEFAQANPGAPVPPVLSSLAEGPGVSSPDNSTLADTLQAVYDTAGKESFDAISYHTYPCSPNWTTRVQSTTERVATVRDANDDGEKPLWLTETGIASAPFGDPCGSLITEQMQAQGLGVVLDYAKARHATEGDLPVVLVWTFFNAKPRLVLGLPQGSDVETGVVAWATLLGQTSYLNKPASARVACEFKNTC